MGEDSNFYSTDSESEVFNQLYYPSMLWNLRIRTACYWVFLVISPREHLHPTGFKSHIFVAVVRLELTSYGFKDRDNLTFILYRYICCTPGGIRTHTEMILSHLPSSSWATGAYDKIIYSM